MSDDEDHLSALELKKLSIFLNRNQKDYVDCWKCIERILPEPTIDSMVQFIKSQGCQRIVVVTGAGISTSAGIPAYISPGSAIKNIIKKYNLCDEYCLLNHRVFRKDPRSFYEFARFFSDDLKPTISHYFLRLLHEKNLLKRIYTMNLDDLEEKAGIPANKIVQAAGSFSSCTCLRKSCKNKLGKQETKLCIQRSATVIPRCHLCNGLLKPDICFVGDPLIQRFFQLSVKDLRNCDLLLVMGSSLAHYPFDGLLDLLPLHVPRLGINLKKYPPPTELEVLMGVVDNNNWWKFNEVDNYRDVCMEGEADKICLDLAERLGWKEDLETISEMNESCHENHLLGN